MGPTYRIIRDESPKNLSTRTGIAPSSRVPLQRVFAYAKSKAAQVSPLIQRAGAECVSHLIGRPNRSAHRETVSNAGRLSQPLEGIMLAIFAARFDNGMVCSHTRPGPVSVARNKPSPPKRMFFTPFTRLMS